MIGSWYKVYQIIMKPKNGVRPNKEPSSNPLLTVSRSETYLPNLTFRVLSFRNFVKVLGARSLMVVRLRQQKSDHECLIPDLGL